MLEQIDRFLAVNGYLPHGYCINWSTPLVTTFVVSDMLIFLAYFSMPMALVYFARQRADFPYPRLLWMFAAFIMACGTTHLMDVVVLWQPWYALSAAFKALTAAVSVITAVMLWPLVPRALQLPSPAQLRLANEKLENEILIRKGAEAALQEAKKVAEDGLVKERMLMAAIVESSQDAIIGATLEGVVINWNRAAVHMFGYAAEEMIGRTLHDILPVDHRDEEAKILATIGRGESIRHFETVRLAKNGQRIAVSISVSPIRDPQGAIIGVSKIIRDISEQKQAEARINELNNSLERQVAERTAELRGANEELEAFAYAVSHDLRAPLRAMSGFSAILKEDFGDKLDDEARECLDHILIASSNMGQLIDGLLSLSRVTRGELNRDAVDLSALAERIRDELASAEPDRSVTWEIEPHLVVEGDGRMLNSALRNLLGNAWKYTAHAAAPRIRISSRREGGKRSIHITDNGAGFDMGYAEQLFQPFRRLHRQDEFPGLGIGLATVQRIIHRHGGEIHAVAHPGEGADFFFTLPEHGTREPS